VSQFSHLKFLLVDDSATLRKIVKKLVFEIGCDSVDEAENGQEGLKKLQNGDYGMVLLDWTMPIMSGLDMLKAVRADAKLKNTPIIMVTAEGLKENVITAVQAGANEYLFKPFDKETLVAKLEKVLAMQAKLARGAKTA